MNERASISETGEFYDDDDRLEVVLAEIIRAEESGSPIPRSDVYANYPGLRVQLQEFYDDRDRFGQICVGRQLGDFRILREVGRGGMGVVYEAEEVSLGRRVALKVLSVGALHDARQKIRFENEARAAAQLKHANIVPVYSVGSDRDTQFYAMQFIDGHSLAVEVVRRRQAQAEAESKGGRLATVAKTADQTVMINDNLLSPAQNYDPISCVNVANRMGDVARIGIQVAGGLEHAHELGVIHRDIKPANLLREKTGDVWIADFGLARCQENSELTQTGERLGTLPYMSPEQVLGENVHHRTDIYSLGVTLYELATLQRAFPEQDAVRLLQQLASQEPIAPRKLDSNVPVDLETIILKAMAKAESERYASAGDLADDLQRFLDHKPILARRPSLWKRLGKWTRRHRSLAASVAAMGVCSLFIIAIITSIAAARMNVLRKNAVDARDVARLSQFHANL